MNDERTTPPSYSSYPLTVDLSLLALRVIVGVIFAAHGSQKMFGWFEGPGLTKTVEMMGGGPLPYLVSIGEFFGGVGLIFGFLTRFSAAANIVIMIGAIAMVHGKKGFFLQDQGFEYNLALIGLLVPLFLCGAGRLSIAHGLMPRSARTGRPYIIVE